MSSTLKSQNLAGQNINNVLEINKKGWIAAKENEFRYENKSRYFIFFLPQASSLYVRISENLRNIWRHFIVL